MTDVLLRRGWCLLHAEHHPSPLACSRHGACFDFQDEAVEAASVLPVGSYRLGAVYYDPSTGNVDTVISPHDWDIVVVK